MFYTIYKITNLINGKSYIGKHQTNDLNDDYFGSGKILRAAIKKHGLDNFKKEILEVYDQEWKMNLAEKIYVVIDQEVSYNICPGGKGGWGYVNNNKINVYNFKNKNIHKKAYILSLKSRNKNMNCPLNKKKWTLNISNSLKKYYLNNPKQKLSDETKLRLSLAAKRTNLSRSEKLKGMNNPSKNKRWIKHTELKIRKFIDSNNLQDFIDAGWSLGFSKEYLTHKV